MFPWAPLLSLGASLLGNIFGNQTQASQTQNTNTATTGLTGQKADTTGTQTTNQTTSQVNNQSSNTQSNESQTGIQNQNQTTTRLDSGTLGELTSQIGDLLGKAKGGSSAISTQLGKVASTPDNFDPVSFVSGIMDAAKSSMNSDLESGVNKIVSSTGAGTDSNSAAALLSGKLHQQAASTLAGIKSQAEQTANQTVQQNGMNRSEQILNLGTASDQELQTLIQGLLGAKETVSGATTTNQNNASTITGTTAGTTTGSTNQTATQQQSQNTVGTANQTTNTIDNTHANQQKNDWASFFNNLGSIFNTKY